MLAGSGIVAAADHKETIMVARCANPECAGLLDYQEPLKLYPLELRNSGSTLFVWLCDDCAAVMDIEGGVVLPLGGKVRHHPGWSPRATC